MAEENLEDVHDDIFKEMSRKSAGIIAQEIASICLKEASTEHRIVKWMVEEIVFRIHYKICKIWQSFGRFEDIAKFKNNMPEVFRKKCTEEFLK